MNIFVEQMNLKLITIIIKTICRLIRSDLSIQIEMYPIPVKKNNRTSIVKRYYHCYPYNNLEKYTSPAIRP